MIVPEITSEVLQAFADAWNRHDVDALMGFMTEDCVFEASAGPDVCGTRYAGREAVRAGFAEVWRTFPDAHWVARATLSGEIVESRSGYSREHEPTTAPEWKYMGATCLPFETARSA